MFSPHVMPLAPVTIKPIEKSASVNADGLKMCTRRPSLSQRISSLPAMPAATIELQIEPVGLEPQKQVDAENDREEAESNRVGAAARPDQQHLGCVREQQLRDQERRRLVDLRPVPAP